MSPSRGDFSFHHVNARRSDQAGQGSGWDAAMIQRGQSKKQERLIAPARTDALATPTTKEGPPLSAVGGKPDVACQGLSGPFLARRRHRYFTTWAHERTVEVQRMALANAEWMQAARKRQLSTRSWRGRREK